MTVWWGPRMWDKCASRCAPTARARRPAYPARTSERIALGWGLKAYPCSAHPALLRMPVRASCACCCEVCKHMQGLVFILSALRRHSHLSGRPALSPITWRAIRGHASEGHIYSSWQGLGTQESIRRILPSIRQTAQSSPDSPATQVLRLMP